MDSYSEPFRHWILDDAFEPLPADQFEGIADLKYEVAYANDVEQGKLTVRDPDLMPIHAAAIIAKLRHPDFVRGWAREAGIIGLEDDTTLHGGGLHTMLPGGWLNAHLDYARHPKLKHMERRLSLVAFLSPTWEMRWGGQLLFTDAMGKSVYEISPKPGRLVVWESGDLSYHGVRQVAADAPPRVSVAVYYLSPIRPGTTRERALFMTNRNSPDCPKEVR